MFAVRHQIYFIVTSLDAKTTKLLSAHSVKCEMHATLDGGMYKARAMKRQRGNFHDSASLSTRTDLKGPHGGASYLQTRRRDRIGRRSPSGERLFSQASSGARTSS